MTTNPQDPQVLSRDAVIAALEELHDITGNDDKRDALWDAICHVRALPVASAPSVGETLTKEWLDELIEGIAQNFSTLSFSEFKRTGSYKALAEFRDLLLDFQRQGLARQVTPPEPSCNQDAYGYCSTHTSWRCFPERGEIAGVVLHAHAPVAPEVTPDAPTYAPEHDVEPLKWVGLAQRWRCGTCDEIVESVLGKFVHVKGNDYSKEYVDAIALESLANAARLKVLKDSLDAPEVTPTTLEWETWTERLWWSGNNPEFIIRRVGRGYELSIGLRVDVHHRRGGTTWAGRIRILPTFDSAKSLAQQLANVLDGVTLETREAIE